MRGLVSFSKQRLGILLWRGQVALLEDWERSGKRKGMFVLGRRSGKGLMGALVAIFNATAMNYGAFLRPGELRHILVIATRQEQAVEFIRTVRELLQAAPDPDLRALVDEARSTSLEVVFRNNVVIRAMPCSSRSTRGLAASLVIFDEAGHFQSDTDGFQAFRSVYRAVTPASKQFGELGFTLILSTPAAASGPFYDMYRAGESGRDRDLFVARKATWEVNPNISREDLEGEYETDPDGFATEYEARFGATEGAYLDPRTVHALLRPWGARPPQPRFAGRYTAAVDPGFKVDGTALVVAHLEPLDPNDDLDDPEGPVWVVIDGCWGWRRAGFENTIAEVAEIAKSYGCHRVRSDQHAEDAVKEAFVRYGCECWVPAWTAPLKRQAFGYLKGRLETSSIDLPGEPRQLAEELLALERTVLPGGQTRIAARGGRHDDMSFALAAAVDTLLHRKQSLSKSHVTALSSGMALDAEAVLHREVFDNGRAA